MSLERGFITSLITDRAFALDAVSLSRFQHFRRLRVSAFSFSFLIHKSKQNPNNLIVQICLLTFVYAYIVWIRENFSVVSSIHNNKHNTLMSCGLSVIRITEFPVPLSMDASCWRSFIGKFCQLLLSFFYIWSKYYVYGICIQSGVGEWDKIRCGLTVLQHKLVL